MNRFIGMVMAALLCAHACGCQSVPQSSGEAEAAQSNAGMEEHVDPVSGKWVWVPRRHSFGFTVLQVIDKDDVLVTENWSGNVAWLSNYPLAGYSHTGDGFNLDYDKVKPVGMRHYESVTGPQAVGEWRCVP